ncbi:MAG: cupin domain-containing protein [Candidatus Marinimicrobia bacterium]|jgi:hypothetical protein|nr:cupin domain-containing protein [Candidatus Neomarinimicrobiota bacterium]MBT3633198.1 cupin domain-containing protein [Candidatus Neomarinimicrobiota bacterium]MBT3682201.1 cupin domain-containing protein [Candidatus Neomarinimicrobiota bacterium]MBT3758798.1 cupin domain-containing protein [Candidatus Neomarinimicrobiota bacterium]MBT3895327.1 cupin domain-containing protein [Candidatus Neomarinimicrobiota bacterium]
MKINIIKPEDQNINREEISSWPIWTCDVSEFDWFYDEEERCLILEGEVYVTVNLESFHIQKGDFVEFPQGLKCRWKVIKPIKKHYSFG